MKLQSIHLSGKQGKEVDSSLFDVQGDKTLVSQAVRVYLANQRMGTAKTKTRAEVDRTKKKWYKQKGTGNARHGARSAPIFVGGGVTHGPHGDASWKLSMSQTMRSRALSTALHAQSSKGIIRVITGIEDLTGKTKEVVQALATLEVQKKAVLLIVDTVSDTLIRATQNIDNLLVCNAKDINTYIVARAGAILITPEGLEALTTRMQKKSVVVETQKPQEEKEEVTKTSTKKVASPATRRRGGKAV